MTTPFSEACRRVAGGADHRVEANRLVSQLTLDEKLGCLDGDTPFWPGIVNMSQGGYYRHAWPAAVVERLGIPGIRFADGPRGAVIADGTAFPVSMARGALFDPALEERVGDAIGLELRASGATYTGAVCMNLLRHPAWGRAQETYGEDPHHVGRMAASFATGLQRHVMACMKHFALNSMENARFSVDVTIDERALHEVYLPHFRRVADAGVASVMSAYNSVNGEWCGENATLLTDILRGEWGWDGFVTSDFVFGLHDATKSVHAGLDIEMPFRQQRAVALPDAIESGELDESLVDERVASVVGTLLRFAAVFEHEPDTEIVNSAPHRALAREVASAATVMLRNQRDLLPIDPATSPRVVVLGRLAVTANLGDGGSSDVKSTSVVTPLAGIRAAFGEHNVTHADAVLDEQAVRAADLVVVVVGYTKHDEGEYLDNAATARLAETMFPPMDHPEVGFEVEWHDPTAPSGADAGGLGEDAMAGGMSPGGDRSSLRLSEGDEELIVAAAALNERVVVSVQCGSAVMMPWADGASSVLVSWYGGVEGGHGLADVLTGRSEPAGRLPFAIPTAPEHLVRFDKDASTETYELLHGQWKLDADDRAAQFPFGAGSGYTTFELSDLTLADDDTAAVTVKNTGSRRGATVVFLFAGVEDSAVERPPRRLVAFRRVLLDAGDARTITMPIDWEQLDVRRDGGWWTEPGRYTLSAGQSAGDVASRLDVRRGG